MRTQKTGKDWGNKNHFAIRLSPEARQALTAIAASTGEKPRTLARKFLEEKLLGSQSQSAA